MLQGVQKLADAVAVTLGPKVRFKSSVVIFAVPCNVVQFLPCVDDHVRYHINGCYTLGEDV